MWFRPFKTARILRTQVEGLTRDNKNNAKAIRKLQNDLVDEQTRNEGLVVENKSLREAYNELLKKTPARGPKGRYRKRKS